MTQVINQEVNVTSYYFKNGTSFKGFPRRIEYGNRQFTFRENGLRCIVKKGQELIEIFNMNDGRTQYRLMFRPSENNWTLLTTKN